jgi:hypothetical protein
MHPMFPRRFVREHEENKWANSTHDLLILTSTDSLLIAQNPALKKRRVLYSYPRHDNLEREQPSLGSTRHAPFRNQLTAWGG